MKFAPNALYTILALIMALSSACREQALSPTPDHGAKPQSTSSSSSSPVLYGTDSHSDALFTIDPGSGVTSLIGPLDPDPNVFTTPVAMAIRPSDHTIFIWNNSNPGGVLLTANPCTGLATPVDPSTPDQGGLGSLAFHPDGRLFGVGLNLYEIDPATGVKTLIGPLGLVGGFGAYGAAFDASGTLYIIEGKAGAQRFATVDLTTGAATVIGNLSVDIGVAGALVFAPDGKLIGSAFTPDGLGGGILFDIDTTTAMVSNIRSTTTIVQGMGFAPPCVAIDIKPDSDVNSINPSSQGVIPVAILGSELFDVSSVDESTLAFGPGGAGIAHRHTHLADVNNDGFTDLLAHFRTQEAGIVAGDTSACLTGETLNGMGFEACDNVRTVPQRASDGDSSD